MGIAYPGKQPPLAVRNLLEKLNAAEGDFYNNPAFTRTGSEQTPCYYLRLGNCNYPHMKLLIETWPGGLCYVFRADTHDKHITVPHDHPEFKVFSELCKSNQKIAEIVEAAWQEAGLPTFNAILEEDLARRQQTPPEGSYSQASHDSGDRR